MDFSGLKEQVSIYLRDSEIPGTSASIVDYFNSVSADLKVMYAKELLDLISGMTLSLQKRECEDVQFAAIGLPQGYHLLIIVLNYWVNGVYLVETGKKRLSKKEKQRLHDRLADGIKRWDWFGVSGNYYDYILDKLVPPSAKQNPAPKNFWLSKVIEFFQES